MTARDIVARDLTIAEGVVAALTQTLADIDALTEPPPTGSRGAGTAARTNAPPVAQALRNGPLPKAELERATGLSKMKMSDVLKKLGPEANGSAFFAQLEDKRWQLTEQGRKELLRGEG